MKKGRNELFAAPASILFRYFFNQPLEDMTSLRYAKKLSSLLYLEAER